jgi:small subunit ribosomal protein S1
MSSIHTLPGAGGVEAMPADFDEFAKLLEEYEANHSPAEGEVVQGTVLEITKDFVTVDIGFKSEGQIPLEEFVSIDGVLPIKVDDIVDVYLERAENDHGQVELSKEKADRLKIWDDINLAVERDELVEGTISGRVKGGLTVDIGVKAFLPGSQVDLRPVRNLEKFIGETYEFKVIKFNKKRGNIVLSRRALLEKERAHLKTQTLENLQPDMVMPGIVKNITDYGCFVDLGGIDGLLHVTDMSWGRINHPSEMFEVGDEVEVMVLKFDQETERVSLGLKQISQDPWISVTEKYEVGGRVKGKVVSLTDYGAFVELEDGIEGLIHVSEMSWTKRVKHPSKLVEIGNIVETVILDVDTESKRISLGMKQIESNPWELLQESYPVGSVVRGKIRNITNFGVFIGIEEGIDGLIHVSDLSWSSKVKNPADIYEKGDEVEAVVLNIDVDKERFSLGIKQLTADPWENVESRYPLGSVVEGHVSKLLDFGAIVEIDEAVEGLVHISELRYEKVNAVSDVVREGSTVRAKVISLIPEERKIGLSLKRLSEEEASAEYSAYVKEQRDEQATTLGDLLGDKLSGISADEAPPEEAVEAAADEAPAEEAVEAAEAAAEEAPAEEAVEAAAEEAPAEEAVEAAEAAAEESPAEEAVEAAAEEAPPEEAVEAVEAVEAAAEEAEETEDGEEAEKA